jgi:hypothetical protein
MVVNRVDLMLGGVAVHLGGAGTCAVHAGARRGGVGGRLVKAWVLRQEVVVRVYYASSLAHHYHYRHKTFCLQNKKGWWNGE